MKFALRISVVLVLLLFAALAGAAWRRVCLPLSGVNVTINGVPQESFLAQTCPSGIIRVVIPGESEVLINSDLKGGSYPGTQFVDILGLTFPTDPIPMGVSMRDTIKTEVDPNFEFTDNSITYTALLTRHRIMIRINS